MSRFPFVQFELAGTLRIGDGRYPVRPVTPGDDAGPTEAVLVARTLGAPVTARRRRRAKPRSADPDATPTVPVTELTVIETGAIEGDADAWLAAVRRDERRRDELVERALVNVRRAVSARRVAGADADLADPSPDSALAIRIGFGDGDALVDGRYEDAIELPPGSGPRGRTAALRPQERMAALLGGREQPLACEELILRARSDLDAGRAREAALQIRVGLEALLAAADELRTPGQDEDLAFLDSRRTVTGEAANDALRGEPTAERTAEVAETVAVCERVLRRRAILG